MPASQCVKGLPDQVREELTAQIKSRVERGETLVDAVSDAFRTHVNYDRLDVGSNTEELVRYVQNLLDKETFKGIEGVRGLDKVKQLAIQELSLYRSPEEFTKALASDAATLKRMESRLVAGRMLRNTLSEDISNLAELASKGDSAALDALTRRTGTLLNLHYYTQIIQTEGARIPSSGRVIANAPQLKAMVDGIERTIKEGGQNGEALLHRLAAAGGDAKATMELLKPFEMYAQKGFNKVLSLHNEYWLNSILSGFKTFGTNFLSNMVNTLVLPAERIIGGALTLNPSVMSHGFRMYGNLAASVFDIFRVASAADSSIGRAVKSAWTEAPFIDAIVHGGERVPLAHAWSSKNLNLDSSKPLGMLIDGLGQVIRIPSRLLTGADEFFKQINYRSSLRELGLQEAEKAGLFTKGNGKAVSEFVDKYIQDGFGKFGEGVNQAALEYAQRATFTSPLREGTIGRSLQNMIGQHPGIRLLLPFVRTPTNIMRQFWQFTPGLNLLQGEFREMRRHPDINIRRGALGRFAVGSAAVFAVGSAALSGKITGSGPSNKEQRDALMATGWKPYSFVVEDEQGNKEYLDYRRIDPMASLFGLVADFVEASHGLSEADTGALATAMSLSIAKNVTSRTYFMGIAEAANLLTDPDDTAKKWLTNRLASYVPNALAQANPDPHFREIRDLLDGMRSRIPGISETMAPKRNYLGETIAKPPGWTPWDEEGDFKLSPVSYSRRLTDTVKDEIANLQVGVSKPASKIEGVDLTLIKKAGSNQDAYDRYQQLTGEVKIRGKSIHDTLEKLIASDWYKSQPAPSQPGDRQNPRVRAVMGVFADYRDAAREQLMTEYPEVKSTIEGVRKTLRQQHSPRVQKILNF